MPDELYNFAGLRATVERVGKLEAWSNSDPDPDFAALVNQAWAEFSWDTECVEASGSTTVSGVSAGPEFLSLTASATPESWKTLYFVRYGTSDTYLDETSIRRELAANPHIFTTGTGTPTRYAITEPDQIALIPGPATSASGTAVDWRGIREGSRMDDDTDEPGCPKAFRRGIVYKACVLLGESNGASAEKLAYYEAKYQAEVIKLKRYLSPLRNRATERTVYPRFAGRVRL